MSSFCRIFARWMGWEGYLWYTSAGLLYSTQYVFYLALCFSLSDPIESTISFIIYLVFLSIGWFSMASLLWGDACERRGESCAESTKRIADCLGNTLVGIPLLMLSMPLPILVSCLFGDRSKEWDLSRVLYLWMDGTGAMMTILQYVFYSLGTETDDVILVLGLAFGILSLCAGLHYMVFDKYYKREEVEPLLRRPTEDDQIVN